MSPKPTQTRHRAPDRAQKRAARLKASLSDLGAAGPVGADGTMLERTGDDLSRARAFCSRAGVELRTITDNLEAPADANANGQVCRSSSAKRDVEQLVDRLTGIQRDAKLNRARAIYRGAQDVLCLLQGRTDRRPVDWPRVDGRLRVLDRLIGRYETGLCDVEAQTAAQTVMQTITQAAPQSAHAKHDAAFIGPLSDPALCEPTPLGLTDTGAIDTDVTDLDRAANLTAHDTLTSLLPHASADERAALERLMTRRTAPVPDEAEGPRKDDLPKTPPDMAAENTSLSSFVNASDPASETRQDVPRKARRIDPADAACLDTLMPDLVQRLLGVAHQFGKVLSVSHAVDAVRIPRRQRDQVCRDLYECLSARIAADMPLQGVGHLDICESAAGLRISGSGFAAFDLALPDDDTVPNDTGLGKADGDSAPAAYRPMINLDTEADLRAQLAALLDGGL